MNRALIMGVIRFVPLILLQVVVLNNINFTGYLNPMLYVLILLSLPIETSRGLMMIIGLLTGLMIDIFTRTPGLHMGACVLMGFIRPSVLQYMAPRDGYEFGVKANVNDFGFVRYSAYAAVLIFLHHSYLFYAEAFTVEGFFNTLLKVVLSSSFTFVMIMSFQLFIMKRKASEF